MHAEQNSPGLARLLGRALLRLFVAFLDVYALFVWLMLILHVFPGESLRIVRWLNEGIHVAVLFAIVLLPISALLHRWRLAGLVLPLAIVTLIWYGPYFLPKTPPALANDTPRITIMSYNVRAWHRPNYDNLMAIVHSADADIVAFQEFPEFIYSEIEADLRQSYPHHACDTEMGKCIVSRYPIEATAYWKLYFLGQQRALINIDGRPLVIYNNHLHPLNNRQAMDYRDRDLDYLLELVEAEDAALPLIVLGDFNTGDRTDLYKRMRARFNDAWIEAGQGIGFTYGLTRLDYVFYEDDFIALGAEVISEQGGSDHHPLLVELAWPQGDS